MLSSLLHGVTISSQRVFSLTIVFPSRVRSRTLCAQWTCHVPRTRILRIPIFHVTCHWLMYLYVPVPVLRVSPYLYRCTVMDCRLVSGYLFVPPFLLLSRQLVYAYHYCLCLSFCSLSTRLLSRYFWTLTRH